MKETKVAAIYTSDPTTACRRPLFVASDSAGFSSQIARGIRDGSVPPVICVKLKIPHEIVVLPDTPHHLGLDYQRAGKKMTEFLGRRLRD